jgi:hypothetical protein
VQLCGLIEPCLVDDEITTPTLDPPKKPLLQLLNEQAQPTSPASVRMRATLSPLPPAPRSPLAASGLVPAPAPPPTPTLKAARARTTLPPAAPQLELPTYRDEPIERALIAQRDAAWQSLLARVTAAAEEHVALIKEGKAAHEHRISEWQAALTALIDLYA